MNRQTSKFSAGLISRLQYPSRRRATYTVLCLLEQVDKLLGALPFDHDLHFALSSPGVQCRLPLEQLTIYDPLGKFLTSGVFDACL